VINGPLHRYIKGDPMSNGIVAGLNAVGGRLNWVVERFCALLMAALVMVIWFEVFQRYALRLGFTWGEEFSRYVMIWAALMAVPVGAYRREHIGLELVANLLPPEPRRWLRLVLDLIGLGFFLFLTVYGIGMAAGGKTQYASIFGMTMVVPFASVPLCGALTSFQLIVTMLREFSNRTEVQAS
jgi:TRAP-type C4-dicarboxylate transport system permease small subunit